MNIFIVGGTGFLGYHTALEALRRGHTVTALGLPPVPQDDVFARDVRILLRDIEQASDDELRDWMTGHSALVFAAGLDDRSLLPKPSHPLFYQANVEVTRRVLNIAKQAGIRRAVILGSYFAHFNRQLPQLKLAERHPYIRSRVEQEQVCLDLSAPGFDVMVLELPYIFGSMPARKPLWTPLIQYIERMNPVFYMKGGSACVTAHTVAGAILGALQNGHGGGFYPISDENLTWTEMLTRLAHALGKQIRVITLPTWILSIASWGIWCSRALRGKEAGLNMKHFASLQTTEMFIDPALARSALGFPAGDLEQAFKETVTAAR